MKVVIINKHFSRVLGGSEIQCHQIAEAMHAIGIDLCYLAVEGVDDGFKADYPLRVVENNAHGIVNAILQEQPDVVYWRFNKRFLASVVGPVKSKNIRIVFSVSHILDLKPYYYKSIPGLNLYGRLRRQLSHWIRGWHYAKALKQIDGVVCNNEDHLEFINHNNKAYISNSPFLEKKSFEWSRPYIVWVGNLKAHKHPEVFIQLAGDLADIQIDFIMVGEIQQQAYDYVKEGGDLPQNFYYLGKKGILETNGIIDGSQFLVHTCEAEGFPNVFLQAWGYAKPVVSQIFDPGGQIEEGDAGFLSGNYGQLKTDCMRLIESPELLRRKGENAKELIEQRFIKEQNIKSLLNFLNQTLQKSK